MNPPEAQTPNGPIAAALLAAAIACFTLGVFTTASDLSKPINKFMAFYPPAGALTGETTLAIVIWLAAWILLARRWRNASLSLRLINTVSFTLLLLGLLLTFPPFIDVL